MVFKIFPNLKNRERGLGLIEIVVAILLIALFSAIMISDFPKVLKSFALSRAAYTMAQELRKTQDLGLSGVVIKNENGTEISAQGYGFFVNLDKSATQYITYADADGDYTFNWQQVEYTDFCSSQTDDYMGQDCVLDLIDVSQENPDVYIKELKNIPANYTSINFSPPHPDVNILNICSGGSCSDSEASSVGITLGLYSDNSAERTVWINTSGLINIQ